MKRAPEYQLSCAAVMNRCGKIGGLCPAATSFLGGGSIPVVHGGFCTNSRIFFSSFELWRKELLRQNDGCPALHCYPRQAEWCVVWWYPANGRIDIWVDAELDLRSSLE